MSCVVKFCRSAFILLDLQEVNDDGLVGSRGGGSLLCGIVMIRDVDGGREGGLAYKHVDIW